MPLLRFGRDHDPRTRLLGQLERGSREVLIGCTLGALVAVALSASVLFWYERRQLSQSVNAIAPVGQGRSEEIEKVFLTLNSLTEAPCSEPHLVAMRGLVFRYSWLREIAYREDVRFLCSSNLGDTVATLPQEKTGAFVTERGRQVWRNVELPLAPGVRSTLIARGRYALLIAPPEAPIIREPRFMLSTVLLNRSSSTVLTVNGPDLGLDIRAVVDRQTAWHGDRLLSIACIPGGSTCYIVSAGRASMLRSFALPVLLMAGIGFVLGALLTAGIQARGFRGQTLDTQLRRAILRNELFLHYQPIVHGDTGELVAAEALIRWTLLTGEEVSPAVFIPIAEENALLTEMTSLALRLISRDLGEILRRHPDFSIHVNIDAKDLADPRFESALLAHVEYQGIQSAQITLELTERNAVDVDVEISALRRLCAKGYDLCIDDFGTGYSNLSYLSDLAIHKIKLDKSFVDAVRQDSLKAKLVLVILEMAKTLDLSVVAEGVEHADQAQFFLDRGISLMQGWLFSAAIAPERLIALLDNPKTLRPGSMAR